MADLDTLRPEVLEALEVCTRGVDCVSFGDNDAPQIIRAELLRLATQVEFRDRQVLEIRKMLSTFNTHGDDRIQWDVNDAVQEVGVLREAIQAYENDAIAYRDRIINLEAELAALKARIADAPRVYHSSFEYTLDASTLYARAVGIPGEETYALVKVEE